ncbi:hypothetical protein SDC9_186682 [bioreactor metagenome]|uniref:Uncharacterized protein n=1 Tax=bioreactor metagenome TaxID=1076179 RepID=A0A645HSM3_9ZZZZ
MSIPLEVYSAWNAGGGPEPGNKKTSKELRIFLKIRFQEGLSAG